jgi:hypothetical protein
MSSHEPRYGITLQENSFLPAALMVVDVLVS